MIYLNKFFLDNPKVAIGFSGGVDSVYLLYVAKQLNVDIKPYFIKTPFQPIFEMNDALRAAREIGINLEILEFNILSIDNVKNNSNKRCYYCKKALFSILKKQAEKDGYSIIIDGTNASDSLNDRPGIKAIMELGIKSPLKECGLKKEKIRELSKNAGLFTWNKSAYSCLATRVKTDVVITKDLLNKIENAETALFNLGFDDFRVRIYHDAAQLQFKDKQIYDALNMRSKILSELKPFFNDIFIDLKGR